MAPPCGRAPSTSWGLGRRAKGIAPALQAHVAQRFHEEAQVEHQREEARESQNLNRAPAEGK